MNTSTLTAPAQTGLGYHLHGLGERKALFLHDWMGDSSTFQSLLRYLDPFSGQYAFADLRGYGDSRHLGAPFTAEQAARDAFDLVDRLGWTKFHLVGHSMSGMVAQRMALDDWSSGRRRVQSVAAVTPVSADGYPADEETRKFLWDLIGNRGLSEVGFGLLTGQRHGATWSRVKTERHLATASEDALRGYYRMWLEADLSAELEGARVGTPFLVVGGRNDLPGFQEEHLRKTFGAWLPEVRFEFITDAGHYPMQETPVLLAGLLEQFFAAHSGASEGS